MSSGARRLQEAEDRLKDIQVLTDEALGYLDVDDLLRVLLARVRDVLEADTAVVLLLDEDSDQLTARAACGLEEEVRQGVRVAVGSGFAGRIAAEKRPVALERVEPSTVTNPILWERGIQSMLGVPLMSGDNVLGVMHVGSLHGRVFGDEDAELLQLVAVRISAALQARSHDVNRAAARVLQRSLLPTALPLVWGLQFATRYAPAEEGGVGGDWYDVFTVDSGDVWVMTGDVAGHGLRAAVVMGRLRSALRAYALECDNPAEVLARADRKLLHFERGEMATVVCAVLKPPYDRAVVSTAGHPPPILAAPGVPSVLVEPEIGPPLGVTTELPRTSTLVRLPPGAVMLMYTDGLVERRDEPIDVGIERLRCAVRVDDAEEVCRRVMDELVGSSRPEDDIAVITLRRSV